MAFKSRTKGESLLKSMKNVILQQSKRTDIPDTLARLHARLGLCMTMNKRWEFCSLEPGHDGRHRTIVAKRSQETRLYLDGSRYRIAEIGEVIADWSDSDDLLLYTDTPHQLTPWRGPRRQKTAA